KLAGAGYQLVGDFDDLIPTIAPAGENPDSVGAEAQANAAVAAVTLLLVKQAAQRPDGARDRHGKDQLSTARHRPSHRPAQEDEFAWLFPGCSSSAPTL